MDNSFFKKNKPSHQSIGGGGKEGTSKRAMKEKLSSLWREQEEKTAQMLAQRFDLPYIDLIRAPLDVEALTLVDVLEAQKGFFIPFQRQAKIVGIACLDPQNPVLKTNLQLLQNQGWRIQLFLCSKNSFLRGMGEYQKMRPRKAKITGRVTISNEAVENIQKTVKNIEDLKIRLQEGLENTTAFVEVLLGGALRLDASDVHIIPEEERTGIRYRLDGIMHPLFNISKRFYRPLLYRLKLLSGLRINIQNVPQDGRFSISAFKKQIEVRVSSVPGGYGEDIVMRILDPKMLLDLEGLGLHSFYYQILLGAMRKPQGMILTTGPTGSGKTTTLYACLKKISTPEVKVITIEEPIEYHLEGIDQTQANPEKGYGFVEALKAALRQDPDIILVGEIRDKETADTAIQAALTGHLVFSTLHTNDSAGIVPRLVEMGVTPTTIAPALNLGMAQRLLRRVCKKCAKEKPLSSEVLSKIEKNLLGLRSPLGEGGQNVAKEYKPSLQNIKIYQAQGCLECHQSGYRGRVGIYEMFKVTPKIEEIINSAPSIGAMRKAILKEGVITMQQDGLLRMLEGLTTLEELERITGPLE